MMPNGLGEGKAIMIRRLAWVVLISGLVLRIAISILKPEVLWIDDGFYSLGIARNIAMGIGWTHDGLHVTNGFQPLYVFAMVPLYWITARFGDVVPQVSLILLSILNIATGWILFRLLDQLVGHYGSFLALLAWSFSPYVISGINGLETSLTVFLLMLTMYLYLFKWRAILTSVHLSFRNQVGPALGLGALAGLLVLARIDAGIFVASLLGDLTLRLARTLRQGKNEWLRSLRVLVVIVGILILVVIPWFAATWINVGKLEFDSGIATRMRSLAEYKGSNIVLDSIRALVPVWQDYLATPFLPWSGWVQRRYLIASIALMLALAGLGVTSKKVRSRIPSLAADWGFLCFYGIGLVVAYVAYQFTLWNWPRYLYPLIIVELLLLAIWLEVAVVGLKEIWPRSRRGGALVFAGICAAYTVMLPFSLRIGENPIWASTLPWTKSQFDAAFWLRENADRNARVAAFQSGISGYYSGHQVINLDGVVNNSALPYYLDGDIPGYLVHEKVEYLADWQYFTKEVDFSRTSSLKVDWVRTISSGGIAVDVIHLSYPR